MKKILIIAAAASLPFVTSAMADTIRPSQALANQGQNVVVEGTAHVHDGAADSDTEIDLTDDYSGRLAVVIPARAKASIPGLANFDGKKIDVSGFIQIDRTHPEIVVTRADQLKLGRVLN